MKSRSLLLTNHHLQELNPLRAGEHRCDPGHRYGPHVREYTLLHYVLSGKGTFYTQQGVYSLSAGQVFVILPGQVTTYEADAADPWHYCWVGFDGSLSPRFSQLPPVFPLEKELFIGMFPDAGSQLPEYALAGGLFRLYAHLFQKDDQKNPHIQKVINYISTGYMEQITVEDIASQLNLDRRYLSRIFKKETGISIQDYLIRVRLKEAERLLLRGCSIKEAARLSGYQDASNFSKMFKKRTGKTPVSIAKKSLSHP